MIPAIGSKWKHERNGQIMTVTEANSRSIVAVYDYCGQEFRYYLKTFLEFAKPL